MKDLIGISLAFTWFVLCVAAAVFLLAVALIYGGISRFRGLSALKRLELPRFQIAR